MPDPGLLFLSTVFCLLRKHLSSNVNMDLTYVPALTPPAGVTSSFINPESRSLMIVITSIICLVLITIISSLRFYTNLCIKKSIRADDSKYQKHLSMQIGNRNSCVRIRRCEHCTSLPKPLSL